MDPQHRVIMRADYVISGTTYGPSTPRYNEGSLYVISGTTYGPSTPRYNEGKLYVIIGTT